MPKRSKRLEAKHKEGDSDDEAGLERTATVASMIRKAILPVRYGGCYVGQYNR